MEFPEFSLFHLVSGRFFLQVDEISWPTPTQWPKIDGQNLLIIFRVNGSIEVANVPLPYPKGLVRVPLSKIL